MSQTDRRELGNTDSPIEDELEDAFNRTVDEGAQRLHRPWREILVTGFFGGTEVAIGVLALIAVREATGSPLLAGLAFSIGFLALLRGRSELFTEGFMVPVIAVSGWAIMWVVMAAFPRLHAQTVTSATHFATAPLSRETLCLALLAGAVITLMTRMQHGTDAMIGKIAAAIAGAFLLGGLEMFHSILDSLLIFGALHTGDAPFGYLDWLRWFSYTVTGNVLGGLLLVTLLRLVGIKDRLVIERDEVSSGS